CEHQSVSVRVPESIVDFCSLSLKLLPEPHGVIVLAYNLCERGDRFYGSRAEAALVRLGFNRQQRTAFDPAMSHPRIARRTIRIIGGLEEFIGAPRVVPVGFGKLNIAGSSDVIVQRDQK